MCVIHNITFNIFNLSCFSLSFFYNLLSSSYFLFFELTTFIRLTYTYDLIEAHLKINDLKIVFVFSFNLNLNILNLDENINITLNTRVNVSLESFHSTVPLLFPFNDYRAGSNAKRSRWTFCVFPQN